MAALDFIGIRRALGVWYTASRRDLPWRRTRDPYRIWVSEIMLQQTRVAAVIPYYERFLERFPDIAALADAPEADLLRCWSGLGYYSRARNMQKAARLIAAADGFPRDYESIRHLPGIGDYTAAAIASIAFGLPYAVLDGNVMRVLARVAYEDGDIGAAAVKKRLAALARSLLDEHDPGSHNQALMELGATVCLPRDPQCLVCPVANWCEARKTGRQNELPAKLKRTVQTREHKTLLLIRTGEGLLLWQRNGRGRLSGFWELPEQDHVPGATIAKKLGSFRHSIMNHNYIVDVVIADAARIPPGLAAIPEDNLSRLPLSTMARKALELIP